MVLIFSQSLISFILQDLYSSGSLIYFALSRVRKTTVLFAKTFTTCRSQLLFSSVPYSSINSLDCATRNTVSLRSHDWTLVILLHKGWHYNKTRLLVRFIIDNCSRFGAIVKIITKI